MSEEDKTPQADETAAPPETKEKKSFPMKAAIANAVGALAIGGVAAGAAFLVAPAPAGCSGEIAAAAPKASEKPDPKNVTYVNVEPLVVSLGPEARSKYLKISISIETDKDHEAALSALSPRIRDVLNNYLRAVEEDDLVRPAGMTRLRAQMLRRLRLVAPENSISDILITDFVLT